MKILILIILLAIFLINNKTKEHYNIATLKKIAALKAKSEREKEKAQILKEEQLAKEKAAREKAAREKAADLTLDVAEKKLHDKNFTKPCNKSDMSTCGADWWVMRQKRISLEDKDTIDKYVGLSPAKYKKIDMGVNVEKMLLAMKKNNPNEFKKLVKYGGVIQEKNGKYYIYKTASCPDDYPNRIQAPIHRNVKIKGIKGFVEFPYCFKPSITKKKDVIDCENLKVKPARCERILHPNIKAMKCPDDYPFVTKKNKHANVKINGIKGTVPYPYCYKTKKCAEKSGGALGAPLGNCIFDRQLAPHIKKQIDSKESENYRLQKGRVDKLIDQGDLKKGGNCFRTEELLKDNKIRNTHFRSQAREVINKSFLYDGIPQGATWHNLTPYFFKPGEPITHRQFHMREKQDPKSKAIMWQSYYSGLDDNNNEITTVPTFQSTSTVNKMINDRCPCINDNKEKNYCNYWNGTNKKPWCYTDPINKCVKYSKSSKKYWKYCRKDEVENFTQFTPNINDNKKEKNIEDFSILTKMQEKPNDNKWLSDKITDLAKQDINHGKIKKYFDDNLGKIKDRYDFMKGKPSLTYMSGGGSLFLKFRPTTRSLCSSREQCKGHKENPNIDCIPVRCATNFTDKMGLLGLKNIRTTNSWKLTEDQASFMNIPGLKAGQEFINYVQLQSEIDPKTNKKVVGCYNAKVSDLEKDKLLSIMKNEKYKKYGMIYKGVTREEKTKDDKDFMQNYRSIYQSGCGMRRFGGSKEGEFCDSPYVVAGGMKDKIKNPIKCKKGLSCVAGMCVKSYKKGYQDFGEDCEQNSDCNWHWPKGEKLFLDPKRGKGRSAVCKKWKCHYDPYIPSKTIDEIQKEKKTYTGDICMKANQCIGKKMGGFFKNIPLTICGSTPKGINRCIKLPESRKERENHIPVGYSGCRHKSECKDYTKEGIKCRAGRCRLLTGKAGSDCDTVHDCKSKMCLNGKCIDEYEKKYNCNISWDNKFNKADLFGREFESKNKCNRLIKTNKRKKEKAVCHPQDSKEVSMVSNCKVKFDKANKENPFTEECETKKQKLGICKKMIEGGEGFICTNYTDCNSKVCIKEEGKMKKGGETIDGKDIKGKCSKPRSKSGYCTFVNPRKTIFKSYDSKFFDKQGCADGYYCDLGNASLLTERNKAGINEILELEIGRCKPTCEKFDKKNCPAGSTYLERGKCEKGKCDKESCCTKKCNTFSCPVGTQLNNPEAECKGGNCSAKICCVKTCDSFKCSGNANNNGSKVKCAGGKCNEKICCSAPKCEDWFKSNYCTGPNNGKNLKLKKSKKGYSEKECCKKPTCSDWLELDQPCDSSKYLSTTKVDTNKTGYSEKICCLPKIKERKAGCTNDADCVGDLKCKNNKCYKPDKFNKEGESCQHHIECGSAEETVKLNKKSKTVKKNLFCDNENKCKIGFPEPVKTGDRCYKDSDCKSDSSNKVSCMGKRGKAYKICTLEGSKRHNSHCGSPWLPDGWGTKYCKAGHSCLHYKTLDLTKLDKFNTRVCRKNNNTGEGGECYDHAECKTNNCHNHKCKCETNSHCKIYKSNGTVDNSYDRYCWKEKILGVITGKTQCKNKSCEQWSGSCGSNKKLDKNISCVKGNCSQSRCCINKNSKPKKKSIFAGLFR